MPAIAGIYGEYLSHKLNSTILSSLQNINVRHLLVFLYFSSPETQNAVRFSLHSFRRWRLCQEWVGLHFVPWVYLCY